MYTFCLKLKKAILMLHEDVRVICKLTCHHVKQNVVCLIQELVRCFILAPCYILTMMMESVFSSILLLYHLFSQR